MAQGHSQEQPGGDISQSHGGGEGSWAHPACLFSEVGPGGVPHANYGITQGQGQLGNNQHRESHPEIGGTGQSYAGKDRV